jgi:hypothetical protein
MIRVLGFDPRRGLGIFLFTTASRTSTGLTQPHIQWLTGDLSLGVRRPGREADHSPPSSAEVKECVDLYLHYPNTPSLRGAQLKKAQGQLYLHLYNPEDDSKSNSKFVCFHERLKFPLILMYYTLGALLKKYVKEQT